MEDNLTDQEIQERARKIMEEKPETIELWETGSPTQQMLARGVKVMAGVE
jgi:CO dehydrogenase/acetyl-CoA synthase epsilon subunit